MDFKEIAMMMWPCWAFGAFMIWATLRTEYKDLVRVEWKPVAKWSAFLLIMVAYRMAMFRLFPNVINLAQAAKNITWLPTGVTLTVFWEDATHGLPLLLLKNFFGTKWKTWPIYLLALALVTVSFGLGHTYQGIGNAVFLSLYIPYSVHLGKRIGFGTVMVNHTLFDLSTLISIKYLLGVL